MNKINQGNILFELTNPAETLNVFKMLVTVINEQ